jgi:hypothetical protein
MTLLPWRTASEEEKRAIEKEEKMESLRSDAEGWEGKGVMGAWQSHTREDDRNDFAADFFSEISSANTFSNRAAFPEWDEEWVPRAQNGVDSWISDALMS